MEQQDNQAEKRKERSNQTANDGNSVKESLHSTLMNMPVSRNFIGNGGLERLTVGYSSGIFHLLDEAYVFVDVGTAKQVP